ncbi:sulfurtransferase [Actibacterium sp. 188UL27-1]|uniref:sulfurtransferase n=1 Tax=Actibacterium sp. 188UL27-1 TaxID=2786961 RepID=UPI00195E9C5C|nr:rhodanese-like domain-containing protein [Actibacterium sp. 188UL27-1]MBM7067006.1 sulfurtransferase [Actibacterium sp. 188UL27-1]
MSHDWKGTVDDRSPLISAKQLAHLLGRSDVKIFDVRGTWAKPARALPEEYAEGHIEGAAFLDWTKEFIATDVATNLAPISDEAGARQSFTRLGINPGDLVVLYDASSHMQAGRIWMAMRHWGFTNVRVLNGGWKFWSEQGLPISTEPTTYGTGSVEPRLQDGLTIDLDTFIDRRATACVIDARGPANYAGKPDDPQTGHIPGALNVPFSAMLEPETGLFLDQQGIRAALDDLAPCWKTKPLIASCGSGYAATVVLLALELIHEQGTLFDGSFAVWKQDPDRPVTQLI